eukprot:3267034-Pyramimonas_sp.AAC.1
MFQYFPPSCAVRSASVTENMLVLVFLSTALPQILRGARFAGRRLAVVLPAPMASRSARRARCRAQD